MAQEIEECLDELARSGQIIHKLSVVGYSLGGLVARYAIGLLYHKGYFDRLEAVNFTTFVTPHLGTVAPSDGAQNPRANDFRGADAAGWYAEQSVECARSKSPIDVWPATFHNRLLSQHRKTSAQCAGRPGQHIHAWAGKIQEQSRLCKRRQRSVSRVLYYWHISNRSIRKYERGSNKLRQRI